MRKFKKFLAEELAADSVSKEAPTDAQMPQVGPPTPAMFAPDSVKKEYERSKAQQSPDLQPGENEEISDEEVEPPPPSYEEWLKDNPYPDFKEYDQDGDGQLNEDEREAYEDAWEYWRRQYEHWLDQWKDYDWEQTRPPDRLYDWDPESNEPYTPGRWDREFDEWWQRRYPDDRDPNAPTLEEYEYWREIWEQLFRRANNTNPSHPYWRELFDWMWRYREWQRGGEQGEPPYPPDPDNG